MRKGFTLLEIVLVVAIIAVLAGIIAPRFMSKMPQAEISSTKANLENLRSAVGMYRVDKGSWPTRLEDLVDAGYMRDVPEEKITKTRHCVVGFDGKGGWSYKQDSKTKNWEVYINKSGTDANGEDYADY